jgi:hypothetical protein
VIVFIVISCVVKIVNTKCRAKPLLGNWTKNACCFPKHAGLAMFLKVMQPIKTSGDELGHVPRSWEKSQGLSINPSALPRGSLRFFGHFSPCLYFPFRAGQLVSKSHCAHFCQRVSAYSQHFRSILREAARLLQRHEIKIYFKKS